MTISRTDITSTKGLLPQKTEKQLCEESGGFWDSINKVCLLAPPMQEEKKKELEVVTPPKGTVETFKDVNTGKLSGFTLNGNTYLGATPQQVQAVIEKNNQDTQTPSGINQSGTYANQVNSQKIINDALSQLGQIPQNYGDVQQAPIDVGQALTAGTIGNLPSIGGNIAGGVAAGAIAGSVIPGVGNIAGGVIGGVGGLIKSIYSGVLSNIKSQQKGEISASVDVLTNAKTNMRQLAMMAGQDPGNAAQYVQAYNEQLAQVYQAKRQIQAETSGNLNKFIEDGTSILSDFDLFLGAGGTAQIYGNKLSMALLTGKPQEITAEDLLLE